MIHHWGMDLKEELLYKLTEASAQVAVEQTAGGGDPMTLQWLDGRIKALEEVLELVG